MSNQPLRQSSSGAGALALVGFMGSGKTSVGRTVAEKLGLPFVDTDVAIEAQAGPIGKIFAERGESVFRQLERDVVVAAVEAAGREPCVLALGGGAVLSGDVREALGRLPHVAWLTAPPEVLWARVRAAREGRRPLAQDEVSFRRLLEERSEFYRQVATVEIVNDGSRAFATVVDAIATLAGTTPDGRCVRGMGK